MLMVYGMRLCQSSKEFYASKSVCISLKLVYMLFMLFEAIIFFITHIS
jgi:hypothetical protein